MTATDNGKQKTKTLLATVELPALEENNLVEFPLALLADSVPHGIKTLEFEDSVFDKQAGQTIPRKLTITGSEKFGLPSWWDQDVLLALMVHTFRQNGFRERNVSFSIYQLRELLGLAKSGNYNNRIVLSLDRWCFTGIKFENAWRKGEKWKTESFCILNNVTLSKGRDFDRDEEQLFQWNDKVVESIQSSYTKPFDWGFYKSLKNPTAKRLYRFLDKRFYHRRKWDFEGVAFAIDKLGLMRDQSSFRYKQRIQSGVKELERRGFLKSTKFEKSGKGRFRVYFEKGLPVKPVSRKPVHEPTELELELTKRGITNARELVTKFGADKCVSQLENFDDRLRAGEKLGAGWLGKSITHPDGFGFRQGFVSRADRAANAKKASARKALQEKQQVALEQKAALELRKRTQIVKARMAGLTESERKDLIQKAIQAGPELIRKQFTKNEKAGHVDRANEYLDMMVEKYVLKRESLP